MKCCQPSKRFGISVYGCNGWAELPQWCEVHKKAHQKEEDLNAECRIAPTCWPCERWLHNQYGGSLGFVSELAVQVKP